MKIIIDKAKPFDRDKIITFFNLVLEDTFIKNEISELTDILEEEKRDKIRCLEDHILGHKNNRYFYIAKNKEDNDNIVGCIEHGDSNDLIHRCTNNALKGVQEIGTVFVHPDYQSCGIGQMLYDTAIAQLKNKGYTSYCLDSGYPLAQVYWQKKLGAPTYFLKDYWGKESHHMIWYKQLGDI